VTGRGPPCRPVRCSGSGRSPAAPAGFDDRCCPVSQPRCRRTRRASICAASAACPVLDPPCRGCWPHALATGDWDSDRPQDPPPPRARQRRLGPCLVPRPSFRA
jgi:hypothetical protein